MYILAKIDFCKIFRDMYLNCFIVVLTRRYKTILHIHKIQDN